MKIAIIGTRGIPNNYGGFEQFAEYISLGLAGKGHDVIVYNSHNHPHKKNNFRNVKIVHKYDPEHWLGTFGQFIYDLNCILHLRKMKPHIVLQLGYTSSSVWYWLLPKKSRVYTNMDGLEWMRTKYNKAVKQFLKFAERLAAKNSNVLIADSKAIAAYFFKQYSLVAHYVPYGADVFSGADKQCLRELNLKEYSYDLAIARFEPENNIETVLQGFMNSKRDRQLVLIGNYNTPFGVHIKKKYKDNKIIFAGSIFDLKLLNNLRYYSNIYFHGHSVGGTNPSLLEAMACSALICAHDNEFNKEVIENNGYYFSDAAAVSFILNTVVKGPEHKKMIENNVLKIQNFFSWKLIIDKYELLLNQSV